MAHFAKINSDNVVEQVIVIANEVESYGASFITDTLQLSGTWLQTSFNTHGGIHFQGGIPLRKNYANIGSTYDVSKDAFIPPKPFPSWVLDEETCLWASPVAKPVDSKKYLWNEATTSWDIFIPAQPFPSWTLDESTCTWLPPVARPSDRKKYTWNEDTTSWVVSVPPQPFPSWTLDESTTTWAPPVAKPTDGKVYIWIEDTKTWFKQELFPR
jgi:hypothetical protein